MPEIPPVWYKAQLCQESNLNPNAVSPANAKGLAQIMPGTWKDIENKLKIKGDVFDSSLNIQFGASYMQQMRKTWSGRQGRDVWQVHELALASYNAGTGHILKSQSLCDDALLWRDIKMCLPSVTGKHHKETWTYVARIEAYIPLLGKRYESLDKHYSDTIPPARPKPVGKLEARPLPSGSQE